jgi:hypothetical protein
VPIEYWRIFNKTVMDTRDDLARTRVFFIFKIGYPRAVLIMSKCVNEQYLTEQGGEDEAGNNVTFLSTTEKGERLLVGDPVPIGRFNEIYDSLGSSKKFLLYVGTLLLGLKYYVVGHFMKIVLTIIGRNLHGLHLL